MEQYFLIRAITSESTVPVMLNKKCLLGVHRLQANTCNVTSTKADLGYQIFLFCQAKSSHLIIGRIF